MGADNPSVFALQMQSKNTSLYTREARAGAQKKTALRDAGLFEKHDTELAL